MGKQADTRSLAPSGHYDDATHQYVRQDPKDSPLMLQYGADQSAWQQTQQANRANQNNGYASNSWQQGPDGNWTQSLGFNGPLDGANQSLQKQYADMLKTPMDDGNGAREQALNAAYGQSVSRLDPQWNKREDATRTQLMNQGVDPNSEAWKSSMQDLNLQRNDAYNSALNSAIGQSTAAGDSVFRNNLAARNQPLQQMEGMQQLMKMPQYNSAGQSPTQQWMNSVIAENNAAVGQATQTNQNTADTVQGGAQAIAALGTLAALFA